MNHLKSILITGGTGKVGKVLVNHFLKQNWEVISTSRNIQKFSDIKSESFKPVEIDLMADDSANMLKEELVSRSLFPNVIVHNARNLDFLKISENLKDNELSVQNEFVLGVSKPYSITMDLVRCEGSKLENIIFVSSIYGVVAPTPSLYEDFEGSSPIQYGIAKAAQIHLTKELAVRLAPKIRVNCVSFGGIKGRVSKEFIEKYKSLTPQEKMLEASDVAEPVEFLATDSSMNITGQNLICDGGWTIW